MNNLQIKYFLTICDNKSFSKAAKDLYVSQPSLSKQIASLEKELEVDFFDRTIKSSTKLTPAGKLFYDFFSKYLAELGETTREAKLLNNEKSGKVRICCLEGWDLSRLLPSIQEFNNRFPYIEISFICDGFKGLERGLDYDYFDLGISTSVQFQAKENYNRREIATTSNIVVFSSEHILAQRENLKLIDFKDDILYVLSNEETPHAKEINEFICKSKGFAPKIEFKSNLESILLALSFGKGYAILDCQSRVKDNLSFQHFKMETFNTVSVVWKKCNTNPSLKLLLDECSFEF